MHKTHTLQRTTLRNIRGAELPLAWAQKAGARIDDELIIEIIPRDLLNQEFDDLLDTVGAQAARKRFNEEKLKDILRSIDDERRAAYIEK